MTNLYQVNVIRQLEKMAIKELGLTEEALMLRAGNAAFALLRKRWPGVKQVTVVCGKGNNGGDGYVVARLAKEYGLEVVAYQLASVVELAGAALVAAKAAEKAGVRMGKLGLKGNEELIVDAILGIGIRGEIHPSYAEVIATCNQLQVPILAIDIPSGLEADTGRELGCSIKAEATITFIGPKLGLFTGRGIAAAGKVFVNDLNLSKELFRSVASQAVLISELPQLPSRSRDAHKGEFGHVLIVGGDSGMAGAVRMAGEAALRVGGGLVTVATQPEHISVVAGQRPELMCKAVRQVDDLIPLLKRATVLVLGPGLGQSEWSKRLFSAVIGSDLPMIVDADALNLLALQPRKNAYWILTPHPGEAGRLLNVSAQEIQSNRYQSVERIEKRYGGICVLKGAGTIVQGLNTLPQVCQTGNPGMATGGMGDVLSGVIGGLAAQGLSLMDAAVGGVMLHGKAADLVAKQSGERGLLATDLMPFLHQLVN